jgi:hypothetical protein
MVSRGTTSTGPDRVADFSDLSIHLAFLALLRGKSVVRFCTTVFGIKAKHLFLLSLFWSILPPNNFCFPCPPYLPRRRMLSQFQPYL